MTISRSEDMNSDVFCSTFSSVVPVEIASTGKGDTGDISASPGTGVCSISCPDRVSEILSVCTISVGTVGSSTCWVCVSGGDIGVVDIDSELGVWVYDDW
jgi:hypothetical protein